MTSFRQIYLFMSYLRAVGLTFFVTVTVAMTIAFAVATTFFAPRVVAQPSVTDAAVTLKSQSDIRVLIDVSGSMKQNDPRNLRRPALDLLVQLFPTDSRAGIWAFGKYVNMLAPHKTVTNRWRDQSSQKSRLINSVALHTNIGMALEKAIYDGGQKKYSDENDFTTSVILLTDGVVDIASDPLINANERQRILDEVLPQYQAAGVAIHAIALSTNADVELLERLAIETDGIFAVAEDAEDLNRIFLRAFDQSSPSDRAPLKDNRFLIDSSVEEFTALVFKQPNSEFTQIESPSGQVFNADSQGASLRWFASDAYDLITIQQPEEGEWTINADLDPENRVTVVSDLTLAIAPIANNLYHGEAATLIASMLEDGEVVSRNEFLDLFTVNASMSRSNTQFWHQTLVRDNDDAGIYSRELDMLRNSGDYALSVMVDGKTFKREKNLKFTVREPFRVELAANELEGEFTLTVMADDKRLRTQDVVLTAVITQPDASELVLDLDSEQLGVWAYQALKQGTGSYLIHLTATGYNTEAQPVNYVLAEQELYLNVPGIAEPIVIAEVETIAEPEMISEPEIVAEVAVASEEQQEPAEEKNNWLPYAALIIGNLLLIGVLFYIYKKMMVGQSSTRNEPAEQEDPKHAVTAPPIVDDMAVDISVDDTVDDAVDETVDESSKRVSEPEPDSASGQEVNEEETLNVSPEEATEEATEESLEETTEDVTDTAELNTLLDIDTEDSATSADEESETKAVDDDDIDIDIEFDLSADDDLPKDKKK